MCDPRSAASGALFHVRPVRDKWRLSPDTVKPAWRKVMEGKMIAKERLLREEGDTTIR